MESKKIILGWQKQVQNRPIGFKTRGHTCEGSNQKVIYHDANSHLCTIARTGSGKGVSSVIPNLLNYQGSVVVLDIKGDLSAVTARYRRKLGKVVHLRPFSDSASDAFNPFDLLQITSDVETTAELIAAFLAGKGETSKNRMNEEFWEQQGVSLLAAIIAVVLSDSDTDKHTMRDVLDIIFSDDTVYKLATILDTKSDFIPKLAIMGISSFLNTTDITRSGILSTAQSYLKPFSSEKILRTLENPTFSMKEFQHSDEVLTIYIEIPPGYLQSHASYVKLLFGSLMHSVTTRKYQPAVANLFILDECSSLGYFPYLSNMIAISRGMGLLFHTLWQHISQISSIYPDYESIIANSTLQIFGIGSHIGAKSIENLIGVEANTLLSMGEEEQYIVLNGYAERTEKLNYLKDILFEGRYDSNPLHERIKISALII